MFNPIKDNVHLLLPTGMSPSRYIILPVKTNAEMPQPLDYMPNNHSMALLPS